MKKQLHNLPEFTLLLLSIYWFLDNYLGRLHMNYIALTVAVIVVFQLFFKNKYIGIILASVIWMFSLYMVLAVISEFNKFATISSEAVKLILFGLLLCFSGFLSSGFMFYKYLSKSSRKFQSTFFTVNP